MSAIKKALKGKLVEKYPGALKKLTPKGQGLLVDKLSTKVTSEEEIEDFVDGLENTIEVFVDVIVSESDRRVREAGKQPNDKDKPEDDAEPNDPTKTPVPDDTPAWAKGLMAKVTSLESQLAGQKTKNTQAELIAAAKAKGIPEYLANKYAIGEEFDQEAAVKELETDWNGLKQIAANNSVKGGKIIVTSTDGDSGKASISSAIEAFGKAKAAEVTKTT